MRINELPSLLPEREFQGMIVARAQALGWMVHHDRGDYRNAIAGDPGFPDLVLARGGTVIAAEVKTAKGRLSQNQAVWIDAMTADGLVDFPVLAVYLWRPSDWPAICAYLK